MLLVKVLFSRWERCLGPEKCLSVSFMRRLKTLDHRIQQGTCWKTRIWECFKEVPLLELSFLETMKAVFIARPTSVSSNPMSCSSSNDQGEIAS